MEESKIYDLLEKDLLHRWKHQIEESEGNTWFFTNAEEAFKELESELNEHEKGLLKSYSLALRINWITYIIISK